MYSETEPEAESNDSLIFVEEYHRETASLTKGINLVSAKTQNDSPGDSDMIIPWPALPTHCANLIPQLASILSTTVLFNSTESMQAIIKTIPSDLAMIVWTVALMKLCLVVTMNIVIKAYFMRANQLKVVQSTLRKIPC